MQLANTMEKGEYGKIFTSTYVLDVFFTFMQRKISEGRAYQITRSWIEDNVGIAEIVEVSWKIFYNSCQQFWNQKSQRRPLSLTDCTNVQICEELFSDHIATYDQGFHGYLDVVPD